MRSVVVDWLTFERPLLEAGAVVAGIDEVGRGALAGPVAVGVTVLRRPTPPPAGLNDSKLLSATQRERLVPAIASWADDAAVGFASAAEVDEVGIRAGLALAAQRALRQLRVAPSFLLMDGKEDLLASGAPTVSPWRDLPHERLVGGDRRSAVIAGAAVLAKVARDRLMRQLARAFPQYGWASNVGYGSPGHLAAIRDLGPTIVHRRSWHLPGATRG